MHISINTTAKKDWLFQWGRKQAPYKRAFIDFDIFRIYDEFLRGKNR